MPRRKCYTHTVKKKKSVFKKTLVLFISLFLLFAVGGGFGFLLLLKDLPDPFMVSERKVVESTKIYDRTGKVLLYEIHGEEKRTVVPFNKISQSVKDATIVAEDFNFYQHGGVDITSIFRALYIDITRGRLAQGGSTITQQLVKNIFFTPERTLTRKIKEAMLSYKIEKSYTKEEIFNFYLNQIPYGSNAYGIEAASQTFFGKHASELSINESATIASLPKAPSKYSPYGEHKEELIARKNNLLERMKEVGFITDQNLIDAKNEPLVFQQQKVDMKAPHFVLFVKNLLEEKYGVTYIENSGLRVYTTLDYALQQTAEEIVARIGEENEKKYHARNAALVSVDPTTGQLLAMVGSRDYFNTEKEGNYNITTSKNRQPGSSFKPFAYASFFDKGFTPDTILFDVETEFSSDPSQSYIPANYRERFSGPVSAKSALAQSLNIPAVEVLYLAGIDRVLSLAHSMGISTLNNRESLGLSLVLGGGEVPPIDMAYAYGVFANDGIKQEKSFILKIEDGNGKIIEKWSSRPTKVLSENIARTISSILSDNSLRASVFGEHSPLFFENNQVAAKTGTTQNYRDAWVVGYTPSLSTAVWVGNNDNTPMDRGGAGISAAGPLFHSFMEKAIKIKGTSFFALPTPIESNRPFLNGNYISEKVITIDKDSKKLITSRTPPQKIEEKTFKEIRSILHFINKEDPQGDAPKNPENDPQYYNWETSLREWLSQNPSFIAVTELPPTDFDDIHTEQNTPLITLVTPSPYTSISDSFFVKAAPSAPFRIKEVSFFIDNELLYSDFQSPYETILNSSSLSSGPHTLTVKAYDIYDNVGISEISVTR